MKPSECQLKVHSNRVGPDASRLLSIFGEGQMFPPRADITSGREAEA